MKDYFSVVGISAEFGISRQTLSKKIKELGLDSRKITADDKELLYQACQSNFEARNSRKELEEKVKAMITDSIVDKSGSTIEERLSQHKKRYDNLVKSIEHYQTAIDCYGEFYIDEKNNQAYPSPMVKMRNELLKQLVSIDTKIQDLEDKKKLSIASSLNDSAIDD